MTIEIRVYLNDQPVFQTRTRRDEPDSAVINLIRNSIGDGWDRWERVELAQTA
jgi:hypothetical protein